MTKEYNTKAQAFKVLYQRDSSLCMWINITCIYESIHIREIQIILGKYSLWHKTKEIVVHAYNNMLYSTTKVIYVATHILLLACHIDKANNGVYSTPKDN